jgi:aspartate/methionine/tyrosine aminotransferase
MKPRNANFPIRANLGSLHFSPTLGINERVQALRDRGAAVFHLGFGESPFPVHPLIQAALAAHTDKNMYLPTAGLPELRALARTYYAEKFGFDAREFKAIIGPGSKELLYDIQLALDGDLLLPVPSWVSYAPQAGLTADHVIKIPTSLTENYHITAGSLENAILAARRDSWNPKKLILNYPNNPTGLSLSPSRLAEIAEVCKMYGVMVVSDEIYGLVDHRGDHLSIAGFYPEGSIVTSGLSKHLSLGGYRVGVALIPETLSHVFDAVVRIASETWSTVASPIQYAVVKAFEQDPAIEAYIGACTRIHSLVSGYLRQVLIKMGVDYPPLAGAFYLYPDFEKYREALAARGIRTSEDLTRVLIDDVQVATLPGTAFGADPETLTLRLAACDYNGVEALAYLRAHPESSPIPLVEACCPNIKLAGQRLGEFFSGLQ